MPTPQIEFKLNIVSLANLAVLLGLLLTGLTTYSTVVHNWTSMEKDRDLFRSQILELQARHKETLTRIENLIGQDSDIRLALSSFQAQLAGRMAVLEVELRQLNTTVSKIEGAVQSGNTSIQRGRR